MENKEISFQQFIRNLNENTQAQKYFKSRGLSKNVVKEGLVGFCPTYSRYSFPLLRGRLIVPIRDVYGKTIALAGRQIPDIKDDLITSFWESFGSEPSKCQDRISKWTKGKWINEPYVKAKNLFFLDQSKKYVREKNYIILVEGYFDVYSLYDNGIKNDDENATLKLNYIRLRHNDEIIPEMLREEIKKCVIPVDIRIENMFKKFDELLPEKDHLFFRQMIFLW